MMNPYKLPCDVFIRSEFNNSEDTEKCSWQLPKIKFNLFIFRRFSNENTLLAGNADIKK